MVQLPGVVLEGLVSAMAGQGLPPVLPHGPMPDHLEVLAVPCRRRVGVVEDLSDAGAVIGHLLHAVVGSLRGHPHQVEEGGGDVDGVDELGPDGTGVGNPVRPGDDQGGTHPAGVGVLLVPAQGGVGGLRPSPGDVGLRVRSADGVEALQVELDGAEPVLFVGDDVGAAVRSALLAGAVVGEHHDDGVVEAPDRVEELHQPAQLRVGVVEHRRVRLLEAGEQLVLVGGQVRPFLDSGVEGRQHRVGGDDAQFLLPPEAALADHVPSLVVAAPVLVEVLLGRLVGAVGRPEGQVQEEGLFGLDRDLVPYVGDGVVDQVLGEVVAVLGPSRGVHPVVVLDHVGIEVVGQSVQEPVVAAEAPSQGPLVVGTDRGGVLQGARCHFPMARVA